MLNTPGHTSQDISVIVHRVRGYGTVGVVGDLFYSQQDAESKGEEWARDAWNAQLGAVNRRRILCICDAIVPGHGGVFWVTSEMRTRAGCDLQMPARAAPRPPVVSDVPTFNAPASTAASVQPVAVSPWSPSPPATVSSPVASAPQSHHIETTNATADDHVHATLVTRESRADQRDARSCLGTINICQLQNNNVRSHPSISGFHCF